MPAIIGVAAAVIGAVIASLTFAFNRGRLSVRLDLGSPDDAIFVELVNHGRQPVFVTDVRARQDANFSLPEPSDWLKFPWYRTSLRRRLRLRAWPNGRQCGGNLKKPFRLEAGEMRKVMLARERDYTSGDLVLIQALATTGTGTTVSSKEVLTNIALPPFWDSQRHGVRPRVVFVDRALVLRGVLYPPGTEFAPSSSEQE